MNRKVGAIAVAIVAMGGGAAFYGLNATDAPDGRFITGDARRRRAEGGNHRHGAAG